MKSIALAANLLLLTLIAGLSVHLFYRGIEYRFAGMEPITEEVFTLEGQAQPQHRPLSHYQPIIGRDLFKTGGKAKASAVLPVPAEKLDTTDLNIKLWGTVTGQGPANYAVIESLTPDRRRAQQLYRQGDVVASATIEEIYSDKIILNSNGKRQVLPLEIFRSTGGGAPSRRATAPLPGIQRRTISRKTLEHAVQNVNQLLTQAKIVPDSRGMRIASIRPGSIFRRLGLRNGDVITGVNDRVLRSMDDAMSLYQNLKDGSSVSIQLLRRGRPQTIQYQVR